MKLFTQCCGRLRVAPEAVTMLSCSSARMSVMTAAPASEPMIAPAVLATVFIRLMDALKTVDEVFMLTGGGPGSATRYVGVHIFKEVFPRTNYGYGSAISVIVLYVTIVLSWALYTSMLAPRTSRKK